LDVQRTVLKIEDAPEQTWPEEPQTTLIADAGGRAIEGRDSVTDETCTAFAWQYFTIDQPPSATNTWSSDFRIQGERASITKQALATWRHNLAATIELYRRIVDESRDSIPPSS
jgi:hypothetical protein